MSTRPLDFISEDLAIGVAKIIGGSVILLAVYTFSPVNPIDLLIIAATIFLPILLAAYACKLISMGTLQAFWNGGFKARVEAHVLALRQAAKNAQAQEAVQS